MKDFNEEKDYSFKKILANFIFYTFAVLFVLIPTVSFFMVGLQSCLDYERLRDNAVVTEAVVTDHESRKKERETKFYSYITYTVGGVVYSGIDTRQKALRIN